MHLEGLVELALGQLANAPAGPRQDAHPLAGLSVFRQDAPSSFEALLYEPVLCLVLRGRKQLTLGEQNLSFGRGECLLVSHGLPVHSRITEAPYLALILQLDLDMVRSLQDEVALAGADDQRASAAETHLAEPALLDAMGRYLALARSPGEAKVLGPLIWKEIHYRLLTAPYGGMLRRLIRQDSHASAIARAISQLRQHLREPLPIPDLARRIGMSPSSFHKHFTMITATTPLQYLKELRLLEARRRLRSDGATVSDAAFEVGYESPSQFCREYARKFGVPPSRDRVSRTAYKVETPLDAGERPETPEALLDCVL